MAGRFANALNGHRPLATRMAGRGVHLGPAKPEAEPVERKWPKLFQRIACRTL
jgi:hypothetical protein